MTAAGWSCSGAAGGGGGGERSVAQARKHATSRIGLRMAAQSAFTGARAPARFLVAAVRGGSATTPSRSLVAAADSQHLPRLRRRVKTTARGPSPFHTPSHHL